MELQSNMSITKAITKHSKLRSKTADFPVLPDVQFTMDTIIDHEKPIMYQWSLCLFILSCEVVQRRSSDGKVPINTLCRWLFIDDNDFSRFDRRPALHRNDDRSRPCLQRPRRPGSQSRSLLFMARSISKALHYPGKRDCQLTTSRLSKQRKDCLSSKSPRRLRTGGSLFQQGHTSVISICLSMGCVGGREQDEVHCQTLSRRRRISLH